MIIYGINPLIESFRSPKLPSKVLLHKGKDNKRIQHILHKAEQADIPVEVVGNLQKYCGQHAVHQGVAAEFPDDFAAPIETLPEDANRLVLFDGIRDPHNFGAAIRVCEVFGFRHIIYHLGDSSGLTPVAAKSSSGAIFFVDLYISNINKAANFLKDRDYKLMALDAGGEESIYDVDLPERFCLVIGSEGDGVRFNLRRDSDALVKIPMTGEVNSLNVSCALSAALCEFSRRLPIE